MSVNVSKMSRIDFYEQAKAVLQNAKYECFPSSSSKEDNELFCLVFAIDYIFKKFVSDFENLPIQTRNTLGNNSDLISINLGDMKSHIESRMAMIRESNDDTSDGENVVEEEEMEDLIYELYDYDTVYFNEGSDKLFINTTNKCIESARTFL